MRTALPGITGLLIFALLAASCSKPFYFVGVSPHGKEGAEVFYISTRKVSSASSSINKSNLGTVITDFSKSQTFQLNKIEKRYPTPIKTDNADFAFAMADWNLDGINDLFAINRNGYINTDIYILSGATEFKNFLLQQGLNIPKVERGSAFLVGDCNQDKVPDLYVLEKVPGGWIKINVYSGNYTAETQPFSTRLITNASLNLGTENGNFRFTLSDINKDSVPDLLALNMNGDSVMNAVVYNGQAQFNNTIFTSIIPVAGLKKDLPISMVLTPLQMANVTDLVIFQSPGSGQLQANALSGIGTYGSLMYSNTISVESGYEDAQYMASAVLPVSKPGGKKLSNVFNPYLLSPNPNGIKSYVSFEGKWELEGLLHSADNNNKTAIVIHRYTPDTNTSPNTDGIELLFEDQQSVRFELQQGNSICITCSTPDEYSLSEIKGFGFFITDKSDRNRPVVYPVTKFMNEYSVTPFLVHNHANYEATVWATWTEPQFGGGEVEHKSDKTQLEMFSAPGIFTNEVLYTIPSRASNLVIHIDPVDGRDETLEAKIGKPDNGCVRLVGVLPNFGNFIKDLAGAFSIPADFEYYDRVCRDSKQWNFMNEATKIVNGRVVKQLVEHISELVKNGKLSMEDAQKGDYMAIYEKVFTKKFMKSINSITDLSFNDEYNSDPWYDMTLVAQVDDSLASINASESDIIKIFYPVPDYETHSPYPFDENQLSGETWLHSSSVAVLAGAAFGLDVHGGGGMVVDTSGYKGFATISGGFGAAIRADVGLEIGFLHETVGEMDNGFEYDFSIGAEDGLGLSISVGWEVDMFGTMPESGPPSSITVTLLFGGGAELIPFDWSYTWFSDTQKP